MRYCPFLSERTMTVTRGLAFRACTKAARNGAPSGPVILPAIVPQNAMEEMMPTALTKIIILKILSGCIIPPCNERQRPLQARARATRIGLGFPAGENRARSDHRAILIWPCRNCAEATKRQRRLSMEISGGNAGIEGRAIDRCAQHKLESAVS